MFTKENSNYLSSLKQSVSEHKRIIKNNPNGKQMIKDQINKYTGTGAYKLLSKSEADKVMSRPHHFINSQLVENAKSKSTPIRTVLDGTS